MPSTIGRAAFRIAQEALTNVLCHDDASTAHVCVRAHRHELDIEISDDGRADTAGAGVVHAVLPFSGGEHQ
jgi:signal transduction histidine kinase